jgi:hypothetical protein
MLEPQKNQYYTNLENIAPLQRKAQQINIAVYNFERFGGFMTLHFYPYISLYSCDVA